MRKTKNTFTQVRTPNMERSRRYAYDPGSKSNAELICKYCSSVYEEKHWRSFDKLNPAHVDNLKKSVCPSCHEARGHVSDGVLHIKGGFLKNHIKEIQGIMLNAEKEEIKRNILNRIERIEFGKSAITVYTNKNNLAVEIGKKLDHAYKGGKLTIKWSKDDKPADVTWLKDL
jgi:hypothetical protein